MPHLKTSAARTLALGVALIAAPVALTSAAMAKSPTPSTVNQDFAHLSIDGQKAFADIAAAQQALGSNQPDQATTLIKDAQTRLAKAANDHRLFVKAEHDLPVAPGQPQPTRSAGPNPTTWIPVDGQYIVTETLTPEKQQALTTANQHLHQGNPKQAAQDLQVSGIDVDFILGVAPLQQATADVYRASVFLQGNDAKDANEALTDAIGTVRFVSDNIVATAQPTTPSGKPGHHGHHHGS